MMPLLVLQNGRDNAIQQITTVLHKAGLRVITSFDSRRTRMDKTSIVCPHHGTAVCNCHIVVMLVYESEGNPATLIAYGQDDDTWISLTYPAGLRPSSTLQTQIKDSLTLETIE